ncbi:MULTISPECIES: hypothetical protein [unclassified Paraburkholderia]|uniref:hypothetical protein n=1 Tax=unclassified Paraburkholderia TaxID=2615204 RepID=UPI00161C1579|nr:MULTISPECIES: hypothetical protein [unclassified Paraburkholderia]MBB5443270.1 hypothetical protein [Paraburkholderia sp. WSM4177]MBB5483124.1 hypothetical protein [Paraburkholderia sp. WSM4180]
MRIPKLPGSTGIRPGDPEREVRSWDAAGRLIPRGSYIAPWQFTYIGPWVGCWQNDAIARGDELRKRIHIAAKLNNRRVVESRLPRKMRALADVGHVDLDRKDRKRFSRPALDVAFAHPKRQFHDLERKRSVMLAPLGDDLHDHGGGSGNNCDSDRSRRRNPFWRKVVHWLKKVSPVWVEISIEKKGDSPPVPTAASEVA